jgi:hypothetical protein
MVLHGAAPIQWKGSVHGFGSTVVSARHGPGRDAWRTGEEEPGWENPPGLFFGPAPVDLLRSPLLNQVDLAVSGAAGTHEIEAVYLRILVADPVFTLGSHDDLDGPGAVLDDSVSDGAWASLGHDGLLVELCTLFCV